MKYRLVYAQPRQSAENPTAAIYERKEHTIEADSAEKAQKAADAFLAQGFVTCGSATYIRTKITFMPILAPTSCASPDPAFLPSDEME